MKKCSVGQRTMIGGGGAWVRRFWSGVDVSPSMMNVTATATGGNSNFGVYNQSSSPSPSIRNSSITGDDYSILNDVSSSAQVADTMLDGTVTAGDGLTCVGAYDEAFSALNEVCAVIP